MAKSEYSPEEKNILRKMWLGTFLTFASFNMVKMQANAFTITMSPVIDSLYDDPEERKLALKRHNGFFNTHVIMLAFIAGITYALEKEKMTKNAMTDDAIESIKVALMGPTAGIGDALIHNGVRVIMAGIAIGLNAAGNILGTLLFLIFFGGGQIVVRYYMVRIGYSMGTTFIDGIFESGLMASITRAASILGLTMIGAMVSMMVNVRLDWVLNIGGAEIVMLDIINSIMPGVLSLVVIWLFVSLIKKGHRPVRLVIGTLVISIILAFFGIF